MMSPQLYRRLALFNIERNATSSDHAWIRADLSALEDHGFVRMRRRPDFANIDEDKLTLMVKVDLLENEDTHPAIACGAHLGN